MVAEELYLCFNCRSTGHRPKACKYLHKYLQQVGHAKDTGTSKLGQGVLSTLQLKAKDRHNNWINVRALLDS